MDGKDRQGLKLEKIGPTFSNFEAKPAKMGISSCCGRVQSLSDVIKMIEKTVMNNIHTATQ